MDDQGEIGPSEAFSTTQWSMVLSAGREGSPSAQVALNKLCEIYWHPLYAFVRRQNHPVEEAQDIAQDFFARFLDKGYVQLADPGRGRFRSFLLSSLKNFMVNEWRRGQAERRGGGQTFISWELNEAENTYLAEPADGLSPDTAFDRQWAATLLDRVMKQLRAEHAAAATARSSTSSSPCCGVARPPNRTPRLPARWA